MADRPAWNDDLFLHAWWADTEGCLLAGEYPGHHNDAQATRKKLELLAAAGIGTIIDLTDSNDRLAPYHEHLPAIAGPRNAAMRRLSHPIPDVSVTTPERYDQIVSDIARSLADGQKVYIHCWGGVGRTGTVVGCWHVYRGLSADEALGEITAARSGTRKAHRAAPETDRQIEMIREMERRMRAGGRGPA